MERQHILRILDQVTGADSSQKVFADAFSRVYDIERESVWAITYPEQSKYYCLHIDCDGLYEGRSSIVGLIALTSREMAEAALEALSDDLREGALPMELKWREATLVAGAKADALVVIGSVEGPEIHFVR